MPKAGFQAGPNFPYFFTAAVIFLIKASKSFKKKNPNFLVKILNFQILINAT
jgi:hypothetical protein